MKTTGSKIAGCSRGFTLVELMIAVVIAIVVMAGAYNVYINMHKTWLAEDIKSDMQQTARVAMDNMVREMMMMGFTESATKIEYADASDLIFYEYIQDPDDPSDLDEYRIRYYLSSSDLVRESKATDPPTSPVVTKIIASNAVSLTYTYYNEGGASMATLPKAQHDPPFAGVAEPMGSSTVWGTETTAA